MAVCPKCGLPFSYAEVHVCEGRDRTKLWLLATAAIGAVIGAFIGGLTGQWYGHSLIRGACDQPDATNLCGLTSVPAVPFYVGIGGVIGASVAAFAVVVIFRVRRA